MPDMFTTIEYRTQNEDGTISPISLNKIKLNKIIKIYLIW